MGLFPDSRAGGLAGWLCFFALAAAGCAEPYIESTTVLGDTPDTNGPYEVAAVAVGMTSDDRLQLTFVTASSDGIVILRASDDDGDGPGELHIGQIPGQPAGSSVSYVVEIERDGEAIARDPPGDGSFVFVVTP